MAAGDDGMGLMAAAAAWRLRQAARQAARGAPARGFVSQPEPRTIGMFARGRQLMSGHFQMAGRLIESPGTSLWALPVGEAAFWEEAHGFLWLDDLAAVGDPAARQRAQGWTWDWIARFGRGRGPGWTPDLTGRRVLRWINHAPFLLAGAAPDPAAFFAALTAQTRFLARRWSAAAPGLARFEALCGLITASLALSGMDAEAGPAAEALAGECDREIDAQGGIATRNPEELLEVFTLVNWTAQALAEAGRPVPPPVSAAVRRIAPCLRTLRHADGALARFHGGGPGLEGRLDHALAQSGIKGTAGAGPAMGFLRLSGGRTSVIVDAADPPGGRAGASAHASTLAFELTSGRRPLIVSCGSGRPFGTVWWQAGRATVSHSTLSLEGYSSSRFGRGRGGALAERAHVVMARAVADTGPALHLAHDGWSRTHGLTHSRYLALSPDGRRLTGRDTLAPTTAAEQGAFAAAARRRGAEPLRHAVRFHLHPEVEASLDLGGTAVSLVLRSGEVWVFRPLDAAGLSLEPSVYLDRSRLKPRPTLQIVLAGQIGGRAGGPGDGAAGGAGADIGWTLAKAQDTPRAIRDLEAGEPPA
jgi:uncharacterized heparinase superfamily protein